MNSLNDTTKTPNPNPNLREQLERIGLTAVAAQLDDMLAYASKQRWSPRQLLDHLAQIAVIGIGERWRRRVVPRAAHDGDQAAGAEALRVAMKSGAMSPDDLSTVEHLRKLFSITTDEEESVQAALKVEVKNNGRWT